MADEFTTALEILSAIARTRNRDGLVVSARTITGALNVATFVGLVSLEKRFVIPRAERAAIARCLIDHGFTNWRFERESENGDIEEHGPFRLMRR